MDNNDINTLQMVLLGIIEERNWSRLRDCLDRPPFIIAARSFKQNPSFYGANILHLVLRNWPSRDIIKIIIKRLPETLAEIDCTGRAPLHVAAGLGVNAKVVHEIARAYPRACLIQDLDGKTPLIFATDSDCVIYGGDDIGHRGQPSRDVVMLLARASPSSIILEDNEEKNAIEYALESNADISVVRILQHASIRERHRIQEQSSLKHDSFDDLRSSMASSLYTNSSHSANNVIDADFL